MSNHERFGPYDVHESIGVGGMATVHRATIGVGPVTREVALKRLLPELREDTVFVEDFIREAKLATQLRHPNIVRVLELGNIDGIYFIAMELLRGAPLAQVLTRSAELAVPVPIPVVLSVLIELADALDYAQNGLDAYGARFDLLHRDVSPSNVFVAQDGHIKIIDFGVAKTLSGRFTTQSGLAKGKLGYMASEAIAGDALDARSDLFSVGVVAWEMITGRRLFRVTDDYLPPRSDAVRPPSLHSPDCPRALDALVLRALAPRREDRWPTAAALARALEDVRRDWPEPAGAHEVALWLDELIGRTVTRTRPRASTDTSTSTSTWLSAIDLDGADELDDVLHGIDDARTVEPTLDARFDGTPFDADDRSALGETSPFAGDDDPPRGFASRRTRAPFAPEPSEPSMEIIVEREASVPPPNEFGNEGVTRDGSRDTAVGRAFDVLATGPTKLLRRDKELDDQATADRAFPVEDTAPTSRGDRRAPPAKPRGKPPRR